LNDIFRINLMIVVIIRYIDVNLMPSRYAFSLVFFPKIIVDINNDKMGISILIVFDGIFIK